MICDGHFKCLPGYISGTFFGDLFVRRLRTDLLARMFVLQGTADINMYGVGGRAVSRLRKFDLGVILKISPSIVSLEIGTNGLANTPEVLGSEIEYLVKLLISQYLVRAMVVCQATPCVTPQSSHSVRKRAKLLNQYPSWYSARAHKTS